MWFFLLLILNEDAARRGLEIAQESDRANAGFVSEYSEMEMVLINAHGDQTVRKLTTETMEMEDDGDKSVSMFLWPADVKGTKMLTWSHKVDDDDQWLYLPALKRVKRISSKNKSGSFMGSEFAYEDLGSQEVEKYSYTYLGDESAEARECYKLERIPVSTRSGYSKQIVWMAKDLMNPVRIEYYDRKGELLKVGVFKDYRQVNGFWRVHEIEMKNVQTLKSSLIKWESRQLGQEIAEDQFKSESLTE